MRRAVYVRDEKKNDNDNKNDDRMANEEVLGPRKTMFVLVIVVGCFAVLWPRILAPLILGHARDQLKPNEFDREAGNGGIFNISSMSISLDLKRARDVTRCLHSYFHYS